MFVPDAAGRYPATPTASLVPFPGFGGQVRTASADVNGDGTPDTIAVTGPGTPIRFAVISGADHATVLVPLSAPFAGSETFTGGGFVAAADLDRDGLAEVAITPDQGGGPRVTISSLVGGDAPAPRANFFGIDAPAPRVYVLSGSGLLANTPTLYSQPVANFFVAGNAADRGGVRVAVKDADGDAKADLVVGSGEGSPAKVRVYLGKDFSGGEPAAQDLDVFGGLPLPGGVFVG